VTELTTEIPGDLADVLRGVIGEVPSPAKSFVCLKALQRTRSLSCPTPFFFCLLLLRRPREPRREMGEFQALC
jgi:hypothetical protein